MAGADRAAEGALSRTQTRIRTRHLAAGTASRAGVLLSIAMSPEAVAMLPTTI